MKIKTVSSLLTAIGLAVLLSTNAFAVKTCYDCHTKEKQLFNSRKVIHKPTKDENCESCHKRHGFSQQLILTNNTNELCYSCHADLKEKYDKPNVHFPVAQGKCWDCHDPHSSDKKGLLRPGPEGANDPDECLICHKADLETSIDGSVKHPPFAELNCTGCHTPHASEFGGLLVAAPNDLCGKCHPSDNKDMAKVHEGRHINGLNCSDCHSGHSTSSKGLMSDNTHAPFADGDCETCHSLPDAAGAVKLEDGVAVSDLCVGCHSDVADKTEKSHPHAAVAKDNCNDCHQPHSSRFGNLLVSSERDLCQQCHTDILTGSGLNPHLPVVLGECTKCHDVHGSNSAGLLVKSGSTLCLDCHQDFAAQMDSSASVHPATDDCLTCHSPHEGKSAALLRTDPSELCRDCHEPEEAALVATSGHQPYLTSDCSGCHSPHFSKKEHLLREGGSQVCMSCHTDVGQRVNMPNAHPPATDDCLTCHKPHYSENTQLLTSSEKDQCESCHDYADLGMTADFVHTPAKTGDCTGCHNPHGSVQEKLLTGRIIKMNMGGQVIGQVPKLSGLSADLCYTCHDNLAEKFRKQGTHKPVADGQCDACHAPHGSDHAGFVKQGAPDLCATCHTIDDTLSTKHGGYDLTKADCLECHNPHQSDSPKLVRSEEHPPFAEKDCGTCHEVGPNKEVQLTAAANELCAACHDQISEDMGLKHQHPPFDAGECTSCHGVHAADHKGLLKAEGSRLCTSCHEDVKDQLNLAVTHKPFGDGQCLDCHRPHASNYANLATKPPSAFCVSCHQDLETEIKNGEPHVPVVDGECTACHNAHAGDRKSLLVADKNDLCGGCHDLASAEMTTAHSGFSVVNTDCQNCHNAHVGPKGSKGLLLPDKHPPFAVKQCESCHQGKVATALKQPVKPLCLSCHEDFRKELTKAVVHPPVKDEDGCTSCHGPHVGFGKSLQVKAGSETCFTCHDDAEFTGKFKHQPAFEDCGTCHEVHSGDNKRLLVDSDIMELCMTCHADAKETHYHPMGGGVIDPRTGQDLTCVGCHSPHSSNFEKGLVADRDRKLCVVCHSLAH